MFCDLHTHSVFSDGTYTPTELIEAAEKMGLSAVALTDHNTTGGLKEFLSAAAGKPLHAVAGVEFSTDWGDTELHILGLFLPPESFPLVEERVTELKRNKEASNRELCARLTAGGYAVDLDEIKKSTPTGHINRAHIAAALTEKGYTPSIKEAFRTLLKKGGEFYTEPKRLPALETVRFIKEIGAVAVLAHPFLNLDAVGLCGFLEKAVPAGLDGMETRYSTYTEEETRLSETIAKRFGLKESGGSDFHGAKKEDISLGTGRGTLAVPTEFYQSLKEIGCNIHEMKLKEQPFTAIREGRKTVELRLYDEKRQKIKAGDFIRFTCVETGEEQTVQVLGIKVFRDFKELYGFYEKTRLGYGKEELADPADMEQYYPPEETERYGVVGIEIERYGVSSF